MKSIHASALVLTLLCTGLLAAGSAQAHGNRGHAGPEYRGHHYGHPHRHGHGHGPRMFHAPPPYAAYGIAPYPYRAPVPVYRSYREPAVVIGVDIPPLVFPLR